MERYGWFCSLEKLRDEVQRTHAYRKSTMRLKTPTEGSDALHPRGAALSLLLLHGCAVASLLEHLGGAARAGLPLHELAER